MLIFNMIFQEKYTTTDLKVLGQLSINSKNNYAQRLYFISQCIEIPKVCKDIITKIKGNGQ